MSRLPIALLAAVAAMCIAAVILLFASPSQQSNIVGLMLIAGAGVVAAAIAAAVHHARSHPRSKRGEPTSFDLVAERLDFTHTKKPDTLDIRACLALPCCTHKGKIRHLFRGELDGRPMRIFQNTYTVSTGQQTHSVSNSHYSVEAPNWPPLRVRARYGPLFIRRFFARRSLQLDNQAFNVSFKVKTQDPPFAVTILSPKMQAFLLEKKKGVKWRIEGGAVALSYSGRLKADRIEASVERMRRFWSLIPSELLAWEPTQ